MNRLVRFFRFRLRTLCAMMLVVAVLLAWKLKPLNDSRRAARAVEAAGGEVLRARVYPVSHLGMPVPPPPIGSEWLRSILGDEWFDDIVIVNLDQSMLTESRLRNPQDRERLNEAVRLISQLPKVNEVYIAGANDTVLASLGRAPSLVDLGVTGDFTGAGVRELRNLRLKSLSLASPNLTRACLANLRDFTWLKLLMLEAEHFSTEDVRELRKSLPDCCILVGGWPSGDHGCAVP